MSPVAFEFEKPIVELEQQIEQLKTERRDDENAWIEIKRLEEELAERKFQIYSNLTPWQRVQLARHLERPHALDYIRRLFSNWTEISGDRHFGDDKAIVTGFGHFMGKPVAIVGQQKGKDTKENLERHFGMPHPEGYRKAMRLMRLAEKFHLPVIILIDTPGAYPGIGSEERSVSEAIARNIMEMSVIKTPIVCCVIGEGGSGGALGVGVGDVVLMLENAWYCVISPEGCAAILWRDRAMAPEAAAALKMTAKDLMELEVANEIIPEPLGGAHRNPEEAAHNVRHALAKHLERLRRKRIPDLLEERWRKYRRLGVFIEGEA
ncbi:MAG: acetyl-CoA carboxylase carboxyltransferase subunit alpha [Candidatus Sumerlaeota bacterium]|nr:acetyl-CoA carboxylase carboxyltransferase subunit alpha [Candidatus Sumerlaeota bacterium]